MATVLPSTKPLTINPLRVSQPMGAALAFLGLAQAMPLEHGSRGCTSFSKLFFMRHFNEPIALQTTAMELLTTILGADGNIVEALDTIARRHQPQVIGLITTGLSELQGADIPSTLANFRTRHPEHAALQVVPVATPDADGCLESGFALALEAMIEALVPESAGPFRRGSLPQVTVLASPMLTAGDLEALKEWIGAFGLTAVVVPDLADSLDGHLIAGGYSPLSYGGLPLAALGTLGQSLATLVIGPSLGRAADRMAQRTGVPDYRFAGLMGLDDCDALTQALSEISGRPVPATLERQRDQLLDAMVDCNFALGGAPLALAGDPDHLGMLCHYLAGLGADLTAVVASARAPGLSALPAERVVVGDLDDLETLAAERGAQLLIANSHAAEAAARLQLPLIRAGFPLFDVAGGHVRRWIGYRGSRDTLFDLATHLSRRHGRSHPYVSIFSTPVPGGLGGPSAPQP